MYGFIFLAKKQGSLCLICSPSDRFQWETISSLVKCFCMCNKFLWLLSHLWCLILRSIWVFDYFPSSFSKNYLFNKRKLVTLFSNKNPNKSPESTLVPQKIVAWKTHDINLNWFINMEVITFEVNCASFYCFTCDIYRKE